MRKTPKAKRLHSALPSLHPTSIIDTSTGEYVSTSVLQGKIHQLVTTVQAETGRLYLEHRERLFEVLGTYSGSPQPAEFARQKGFNASFVTTLPKGVKEKYRLNKLTQYKLIAETDSYVKNPTPNKREPTFSQTVNLGAIDRQMATLSRDGSELNLLWKCWDAEYYITFPLPSYVLNRNPAKYTLPVVHWDKKLGVYGFIFTMLEDPKQRKGTKHTVGIDLGRVKPYSMAVTNNKGERVASYDSSPRLNRFARKQERLWAEARFIKDKIQNRATHGLESPNHLVELERTRDKATRLTTTLAKQLGAEIAGKIAKHNSSLIHVEDLRWITGHSGSRIGNSKWAHSKQLIAIEHSTARIGYKTKRVNPRNTSQFCHKCGNPITHNTARRTVLCITCKSILDRDFNAAMNIAKNINKTSPHPASKKLNGDTLEIGVAQPSMEALLGTLDNNLLGIARKTT